MVQLRLEPLGEGGIPKDCYVSVRIGETQKLSRLGGARTYKFPPSDKVRFGKLEVYRRVGAVGIDLERANGGTHDLNISCSDTTLGSLNLRLCMDGAEGGKINAAPAAKESNAKTNSTKVKAAQEYLAHHSLEFQLAEAMQALLRELPEDPVEFLTSQLKAGPKPLVGSKKSRSKTPKHPPAPAPVAEKSLKPAPSKGEALSLPFAQYYKNNMTPGITDSLSNLYSKFEAKKAVKFSSKQPQQASLKNFGAYYRENVSTGAGAGLHGLYAKFPAHSERVALLQDKSEAPLQSVGDYFKEHIIATSGPSVLQGLYSKFSVDSPTAKGASSVLPFAAYYQDNIAAASNDGLSNLYAKFAKHSVATKKAAPPASATAVQSTLHFKPSAGTWLMAKPCAPKVAAAASVARVAPAPPIETPSRSKFGLMPSAATWLASKPVPVHRPKTDAIRYLQGLQAPGMSTMDERCEVERVFSKALLELTGEFEGEYFPLASSTSYPSIPGGMTADEERDLASKSLLFKSRSADVSGQGIFANDARDVAAWLNESGHVRLMVLASGSEADMKLGAFEQALAMALKQDGYDLAGEMIKAAPKAAAAVAAVAPAPAPPAVAPAASSAPPRSNWSLKPSAATWLASKPMPVQRPKTDVILRLSGLQAPGMSTLDERCEVERVLSNALLELTGEFEGEYFPLASSSSYPTIPGGMTADEERDLASKSLLFKSRSADVSGQGIFANSARDVAAWLNESGHVRLMVLAAGSEADMRLGAFEKAVAMALKQDGYDLA